jgi:hypothetical protein
LTAREIHTKQQLKMKLINQNISLLFLVIFPLSIIAQECNCVKTLDWAKNTFEQNDAGIYEYG